MAGTDFDAVDGMYVLHAVDYDPADLLQRLEGAHSRDCVALNEDVAVGEELDGLDGG